MQLPSVEVEKKERKKKNKKFCEITYAFILGKESR